MNIEENRLKTFSTWPLSTVVPPSKIAKAGFFYLKTNSTVECFACHIRIDGWNYSDQVMARHRARSPQCPFVLNPSTSGNVPTIPSPTTDTPSSSTAATTTTEQQPCLFQEEARLNSFDNWPIPEVVSPEDLARAGFYYMKQCDLTKCVYCNGLVRAWERDDDPDMEHKRLFPNCPFVRSVIIPRLETNRILREHPQQCLNTTPIQQLDLITNKELDELGVQTHTGPKRPDYGTVESRLRTFTAWPNELIQTPDILSQAGFYYVGINDLVRCFHCDGGLRHWDPHDDPWTEHAKYFPNCSFIKLIKGQEFVTACCTSSQRNGNISNNLEEVTVKPSTTTTTTTRHREITDRELQEHMRSPAAMAALGIGLNFERVKCAIKEKLEQTGRGYSTADALVEAALNLQRDEDDNTSGGDHDIFQTILHNNGQQCDNNDDKSPERNSRKNNQQQETDNNQTHPGVVDANNKEIVKLKKSVSLEEENRILKEARLCKICMDKEVGIVFLPCGHLATCTNCAPNLATCPVCRQAIKATVRTFLS